MNSTTEPLQAPVLSEPLQPGPCLNLDVDLGPGLGLGLDAGGTSTRWALCRADGSWVAQGEVGPLHALQVLTESGRNQLIATLAQVAEQVQRLGVLRAVHAGLAGYGGSQDARGAQSAHSAQLDPQGPPADPSMPDLVGIVATALGVQPGRVRLSSDVELAYRAHFLPGAGHLVYAGTGSMAVHLDAGGALHRAGGRGVTIDDAGGGWWIAQQALRLIWRREDEAPGAWRHSRLAQAVMAHVGGSDWPATRRFVAQADRGTLGRLALAVAQAAQASPSAEADADALQLLEQAGQELGRLGAILVRRLGIRPVALAGRVFDLHPVVAQACAAALPQGAAVQRGTESAHLAAARWAAQKVDQEPAQQVAQQVAQQAAQQVASR